MDVSTLPDSVAAIAASCSTWFQAVYHNPIYTIVAILAIYTKRPITLPLFYYLAREVAKQPEVQSEVTQLFREVFDKLYNDPYIRIGTARCNGTVDYEPLWPELHPSEECTPDWTLDLNIYVLIVTGILSTLWTLYGAYVMYGNITRLAKSGSEATVAMYERSVDFVKEYAKDVYDKVMFITNNFLFKH